MSSDQDDEDPLEQSIKCTEEQNGLSERERKDKAKLKLINGRLDGLVEVLD
jgi:hypothetical protein